MRRLLLVQVNPANGRMLGGNGADGGTSLNIKNIIIWMVSKYSELHTLFILQSY